MVAYNFVVRLYGLIISIASINNHKAKQWIRGRRNWRTALIAGIEPFRGQNKVWVHCASYGEFEQGRPLIETIRKQHPDHRIILSFFSPSGYDAFKEWGGADVICYLPLDTRSNARDFIGIVDPKVVIFIKYEFWVNFLFELKERAIPTFLVSAVFKPHHPFFKAYGGLFIRSLQTFTRLFIQDEDSGRLLDGIGVKNYEVCGDTRFDRVLEIRKNFTPIAFFDEFCRGKHVIMAGSTWPADEALLIESFKELNDPSLKLIIVPHQVNEKSIQNLKQLVEKNGLSCLLFSEKTMNPSKPVLIVDAMGLLSKLYQYADVAYIGGGANSGIHNCLEPAVYLKPVVFFGDDYHKYNEAVDLLALKAATNISDAAGLSAAFRHYLRKDAGAEELRKKLELYFANNSGTTDKVMRAISWD